MSQQKKLKVSTMSTETLLSAIQNDEDEIDFVINRGEKKFIEVMSKSIATDMLFQVAAMRVRAVYLYILII